MRGDRETIVKVGILLAVLAVIILVLALVVIPFFFPPEDPRYEGIPTLDGYVTDDDFVLTDLDFNTIWDNCQYVDEQTSCEMAVLVVNDTGDRTSTTSPCAPSRRMASARRGRTTGSSSSWSSAPRNGRWRSATG
jgi:hypothetical protein